MLTGHPRAHAELPAVVGAVPGDAAASPGARGASLPVSWTAPANTGIPGRTRSFRRRMHSDDQLMGHPRAHAELPLACKGDDPGHAASPGARGASPTLILHSLSEGGIPGRTRSFRIDGLAAPSRAGHPRAYAGLPRDSGEWQRGRHYYGREFLPKDHSDLGPRG